MGENSCAPGSNNQAELNEIRNLLWGSSIRLDVFRRWSQGFEFSEIEPSALVQRQGGPCAVIAPVQAFLIKSLLQEESRDNFSDLTKENCNILLIQALCDILVKCNVAHFRIVTLPKVPVESKEVIKENLEEINESSITHVTSLECNNSVDFLKFSPEEFHEHLIVINFQTIVEVEKYFLGNFNTLNEQFGVLLFMYSVLLTKGVENVTVELGDTSEPLIHHTYGYGSQGLINLMLTGRAVAHVWDNHQDVGGLKLLGINQQSEIGFITLMEQMRYCTVGSFYKNPKNPVWVMGSETHLTVLFSTEKRLVSPETPAEIARRVFKSYDPDGNNFIPSAVLQDVLCALELVSEPEYVEVMQKKLDPESLGIILLNAFLDEFFPEDQRSTPDTFDLMHYNGIPGSNEATSVKYSKGSAIVLESDLKSVCISNPMNTCLQTKWPNIEVNWVHRIPSLN